MGLQRRVSDGKEYRSVANDGDNVGGIGGEDDLVSEGECLAFKNSCLPGTPLPVNYVYRSVR